MYGIQEACGKLSMLAYGKTALAESSRELAGRAAEPHGPHPCGESKQGDMYVLSGKACFACPSRPPRCLWQWEASDQCKLPNATLELRR